MTTPEIKKKKIVELKLTKYELLHLRDLMSITLPVEGTQTVSSVLATNENRILIESALWNKIYSACELAGLPVGEEAPDYIISPSGLTPLSVFQISPNPPSYFDEDSENENIGENNLGFLDNDVN